MTHSHQPTHGVAPTAGLQAHTITCSDSANADHALDRSGPLAAALVTDAGFTLAGSAIVGDDPDAIGIAVREAVASGSRLIVLTGGTGLGPRDVTPEALQRLGARPIPGVGEAMRASARISVPTADLSRGGAYSLDSAILLALPGSLSGVRDGWSVAGPLIGHALRMMDGEGHPASSPAAEPVLPGWVTPGPLDVAALTAEVADAGSGAVVVFEGRVRNHDHGRDVVALTYEAHPDAESILRDVVRRARQLPGVRGAAARHRVGDLRVGDLVYLVAASAAHRKEAFDACSWLVDTAKAELPIWKHQRFGDGTTEWVNCP